MAQDEEKKPRTELFNKTTDMLFVDLTDEEVIEHATAASKAEENIALLEAEFDRVKKDHKEAVIAQERARSEHLYVVKHKKERREVKVDIYFEPSTGLMHYYRTDIGELYRTRLSTEDERQTKIWQDEAAERQKNNAEIAAELHRQEFGAETKAERKKKKKVVEETAPEQDAVGMGFTVNLSEALPEGDPDPDFNIDE